MSRKYKFANPEGFYFVSFAVVYWMDVFTRDEYCRIILADLKYSQEHKGMEIYCWCIMPSHIHLIFKAKNNDPAELPGKFKAHTSKTVRNAIEENKTENRREWLLWMMARAAAKNSSVLLRHGSQTRASNWVLFIPQPIKH